MTFNLFAYLGLIENLSEAEDPSSQNGGLKAVPQRRFLSGNPCLGEKQDQCVTVTEYSGKLWVLSGVGEEGAGGGGVAKSCTCEVLYRSLT